MNYAETNAVTANSLKRQAQANMFANSWEASGRLLSSLAISKDAIADGYEDSFADKSRLLPKLMASVNLDEMSITDLIILSQAAKAIEDGDTKAATFVRDTAGGKPVEKKQDVPASKLTDLTDEQIAYLEAHAEVIDD